MGTREHLDDQTPQGPDIRFPRIGRLLDDFRGHPEDGTLQGGTVDVAALGRVEEGGRFDALGDAEVGDLDLAFDVDEDVGALDVPVDDIAAVEIGEPIQDLADEVADEGFLEVAVVVEHGGDAAAGDVLEEDVEVLVVGVGAEVLDDVWVLQVAQQFDLALQGLHHGFFAFVDLGVGFAGHFYLLDGHEFASDGVQGEEDGAEGALADERALHPFDVVPGVTLEELIEFFVFAFTVFGQGVSVLFVH